MRILLIFCGYFSILLGLIGIVVPIMPTTVFLLIAAYCFAKSSDKLYNKLINNRLLGKYIRNYREKRGITIKHKVFTISLLWISISSSAIFTTDLLWLRILLMIIAISVTIHVYLIKTYREEDDKNRNSTA